MSREAPDENVVHLEKIKSEKVLGTRYDAWDVLTNKNRWWVISNPMNLYSQEHLPSLDYTLSFHIGLISRIIATDKRSAANQDLFPVAWRKWQQAAEASEQADEPEEYQAVGMRCREALLAFIKEAASPELVPAGANAPKSGDFQAWAVLIINHMGSWVKRKGFKILSQQYCQICMEVS